MDPISLIVAALTAGAVAGTQKTATDAVADAYAGLKGLLRDRLRGRTAGEVALERHESRPEAWGPALEEELAGIGAGDDAELAAAARRLQQEVEAAPGGPGTISVYAPNARGMQAGHHMTQYNSFSDREPPAQPAG